VAGGVRLKPFSNAWAWLAALLAAGTVLAQLMPSTGLDWQPGLAWSQPWRWWTAAFVHWSGQHLLGNLLATALVAAYGLAAAVPRGISVAWVLAWPLTHLGLLVQPDLLHYGGLSGVLHAGVAATTLWLVVAGRGRRRAIGVAMLLGLLAKLVSEQPWGAALRHAEGWDIAIAPLAHSTGALAGALMAVLVMLAARSQRRQADGPLGH
jgi:rhomboid family GlyGly-CTERM serine protease